MAASPFGYARSGEFTLSLHDKASAESSINPKNTFSPSSGISPIPSEPKESLILCNFQILKYTMIPRDRYLVRTLSAYLQWGCVRFTPRLANVCIYT